MLSTIVELISAELTGASVSAIREMLEPENPS